MYLDKRMSEFDEHLGMSALTPLLGGGVTKRGNTGWMRGENEWVSFAQRPPPAGLCNTYPILN
jgi:hypothetical protein